MVSFAYRDREIKRGGKVRRWERKTQQQIYAISNLKLKETTDSREREEHGESRRFLGFDLRKNMGTGRERTMRISVLGFI
ncbi:hypothetical protein RchiOBHm_Chr7g0237211 [Rosa chinensis]|uniref:Uncharacterized protein n=1 Tax=Rosa chinensis TaxID=74649 RepID=A0A2P6PH78_ROSCH|nr:hypothetical protein RchiOBHm_Chr7g0237211 [Rosa chinensis]